MSEQSEQIESKLCAYIEGELDEQGRVEIEKHLDAHPSHRHLFKELAETRRLMRLLPRENAPADLAEQIQAQLERTVLLDESNDELVYASSMRINRWPQYFAAAAIVMLAIGLGVVVYFALPKPGGTVVNYSIGPDAKDTLAKRDNFSAREWTETRQSAALGRGNGPATTRAATGLAAGVSEKGLAETNTALEQLSSKRRGRAELPPSVRRERFSLSRGGGVAGGAGEPVVFVVSAREPRQATELASRYLKQINAEWCAVDPASREAEVLLRADAATTVDAPAAQGVEFAPTAGDDALVAEQLADDEAARILQQAQGVLRSYFAVAGEAPPAEASVVREQEARHAGSGGEVVAGDEPPASRGGVGTLEQAARAVKPADSARASRDRSGDTADADPAPEANEPATAPPPPPAPAAEPKPTNDQQDTSTALSDVAARSESDAVANRVEAPAEPATIGAFPLTSLDVLAVDNAEQAIVARNVTREQAEHLARTLGEQAPEQQVAFLDPTLTVRAKVAYDAGGSRAKQKGAEREGLDALKLQRDEAALEATTPEPTVQSLPRVAAPPAAPNGTPRAATRGADLKTQEKPAGPATRPDASPARPAAVAKVDRQPSFRPRRAGEAKATSQPGGAGAADEVVRKGDRLRLLVEGLGESEKPVDQELSVAANGVVDLPLAGRLKCEGLTLDELEDRIAQTYHRRVNPTRNLAAKARDLRVEVSKVTEVAEVTEEATRDAFAEALDSTDADKRGAGVVLQQQRQVEDALPQQQVDAPSASEPSASDQQERVNVVIVFRRDPSAAGGAGAAAQAPQPETSTAPATAVAVDDDAAGEAGRESAAAIAADEILIVQIRKSDGSDESVNVRVAEDGTIDLKDAGKVRALGRAPSQVEADVMARLKKAEPASPGSSVSVTRPGDEVSSDDAAAATKAAPDEAR